MTSNFIFQRLDITNPGRAAGNIQNMRMLLILPTYVIFNANVTDRSPLEQISQENWKRVFRATYISCGSLTAVASSMEPGGLFAFGSLMAVYPHSVSLAYGVTKSAVHALVHNLVKHLGGTIIVLAGRSSRIRGYWWQKTKHRKSGKISKEKWHSTDLRSLRSGEFSSEISLRTSTLMGT